MRAAEGSGDAQRRDDEICKGFGRLEDFEHRDAISDADATARERRARTSKNIDAEGIRFAVSDPRDARRERVLEGADAGE